MIVFVYGISDRRNPFGRHRKARPCSEMVLAATPNYFRPDASAAVTTDAHRRTVIPRPPVLGVNLSIKFPFSK